MTESLIDVSGHIPVRATRRNGRAPWYCFTVGITRLEELAVAQERLSRLRTLFEACHVEDGKLHVLFKDNYVSRRARDRGHETALKVAIRNIRIAISEHKQTVSADQDKQVAAASIPQQRSASNRAQPAVDLTLSPQGASI